MFHFSFKDVTVRVKLPPRVILFDMVQVVRLNWTTQCSQVLSRLFNFYPSQRKVHLEEISLIAIPFYNFKRRVVDYG